MSAEAHPLSWPAGRPRTPDHQREPSKFRSTKRVYSVHGSWNARERISVSDARKRIYGELDRFGAQRCVVSSNLVLNLDGTIRASQKEPADPGVAVYFTLKGRDYIMACDRWNRTADNLAAIAKAKGETP